MSPTKKKTKTQRVENFVKVLQMSKAMQTRFKLIPSKALNNVTVAGIRDMSFGRVKDGRPVGANIIRVNNPSPGTNSNFHRICIDPNGISNKANPHIPISSGTVDAASKIQTGLKITGKVLFVVSLLASGVRVAKSIYDEVTIDDEVESLEEIISALEEDLTDTALSSKKHDEIKDALELSKELLREARDNKANPGKKTLVTLVCIGGEYGGAAIGGLAGAKAGCAIGAVGGPVGMVAGAVVGSVVGACVGGEAGGSLVGNFKCDSEGISTEMDGSLLEFGDTVKSEVVGLRGNFSVGNDGLSTGVGGSLFEMKEENAGALSVLKAGAKADFNYEGLDVGVEGKLVRAEAEFKNVTIGTGLNLDTGAKIGSDGVKVEFLGFGLSAGNEGWGFKLPIFDMKFKK